MNKKRRILFIFSALTLLAFSKAQATFSIIRVGGGSNNLVAGKYYTYKVTNTDTPLKLQDVFVNLSNPANADIFVAPGVQTGSTPPRFKLDSLGQLVFQLRFHRPGNYSFTVVNSADSNNNGSVNPISVQDYPTHFSITPNNPTVNANQVFQVTITALDRNGAIVSSYEDDAQISDSQLGDTTSTSIQSIPFVNGQASNVNVTVRAADINNQFTLTITGNLQYFDPINFPASPNLSLIPQSVIALSLVPGSFNKLVMLFPGEVFNPGFSKDSTGILPQVSGTPVTSVKVYRVDQWFNPILSNPSPALDIRFTSSAGLTDTAFPHTQTMTGGILDLVAGMNLVNFGGSGTRIVTAAPIIGGNPDPSKADSTTVVVDPGTANSYDITILNPSASYTTDDVINVRIRAFDINGVLLNTLFGPVANAQLQAVFGAGAGNRNWVDTNVNSLIPDNVISFVAGSANASLVVTKAGVSAKLRYVVPGKPNIDSPTFDVNAGGVFRVHFTIIGTPSAPASGEVFTAGTYPGNNGVAPTVQAGQRVLVEARVTDKRWNVVDTGVPFNATIQLVDDLPNNYIDATHRQGTVVTIPSPGGELLYDPTPSFNNAFTVTCFTAGPNTLVPSPRIKGLTTNLGAAGGSTFFASTQTVLPGAYTKLILQASNETLRPGTDLFPTGKEGTIVSKSAGVASPCVVYATDQYFNPLTSGPFPQINFQITPNVSGSFVVNSLPLSMSGSIQNVSIVLKQDSTIKVFDTAQPAINQTVTVPVGFGPLDHFLMTVTDTVTPKRAGVLFNVTFEAKDQFDNTVANYNQTINVQSNTGANTMSINTVNLVNGTANLDMTVYTATSSAIITMSMGSVSSQSSSFPVLISPLGYKKLLMLLPGESAMPGVTTLPGKTGTPTPITAGVATIVTAIACDPFFNPVMPGSASDVIFTSNHYAQFTAAQGTLVNVNGQGQYSTPLILRAATMHTLVVTDVNNPLTISNSSSTIDGQVGAYKMIQVLAPGEVADAGTFVPNGKTAAVPINQKQGVPFTVTMNAVDDFWNIVPFNGGDVKLDANTTSILFTPPNNTGTPNTPRVFTNGVASRQVIVGQEGLVQISATDRANLTKPGQTVQLTVDPGPIYKFQMSNAAVAGQVMADITITLEEGGVPLVGYNSSIFLTATLPNGNPASANFNADGTPRAYVMNNGSVVISDLVYDYVEPIQIRLGDNFNRVAFSPTIDVVPSGLKYSVSVPTSAVAGPPSTFNVTVQLLDENTSTLVKNHDHQIQVQLISVESPTTDGQYTVTGANLAQGQVTFQESYTKAESVIIKITESTTAGDPNFVVSPKTSNNILVLADGYKKLALLAPGETIVSGVPSSTGKTGIPATRQVGVPFLMQVRGVDQYWNEANSFSGGQILFTSNDNPPSLNTVNPNNQNAPLVNGQSASSLAINNPGNITVTVRDASSPSISGQSVQLTVGGNFYRITVPNQQFAGPPTTFTMNVTLIDFNTKLPVTAANNAITIQAFNTDGTPAAGTLGVTAANLSNGTVGITDQTYSIPENVFLRITDPNGNIGNSVPIQFISRQVRYVFQMPTEGEVNVPFNVIVQTIDQDTGSNVKTLNRTNSLQAYSNLTGLLATGSFIPGSVNIINGVGTVSAVYNKAEPIFLIMTDSTLPIDQSPPTQSTFTSAGSINIKSGPLADVSVADFTMRANQSQTVTLIALDTFGNPSPNQTLNLTVSVGGLSGQMKMNGQFNSLVAKTDGQGQLVVNFDPTLNANGVFDILIQDGDRVNGFSKVLKITVQGFPLILARAPDIGGNRIYINNMLHLPDIEDLVLPTGAVKINSYYSVDGGDWTQYDKNVGIGGFSQTRTYKVDWYSEVCYDVACSNPVSQRAINGGPNSAFWAAIIPSEKLDAYPSPFNPKDPINNLVTLQYPLTQISGVEIDIFDLFGQPIWHKDIDPGDPMSGIVGQNKVFWPGINDDGSVVANGGYIVRLKIDATGQIMKTKVLVVK